MNHGIDLGADIFAEIDRLRTEKKAVIRYISCSAAVRAMSDLICTSWNAEKIVRSIPEDKEIVFAPDQHFGRYLIRKIGW